MAKPNTTLRPVSFLDLPGEIKNLIYNIVLNGSVIKLDHKARGRLKDKSPPPPLDLSITPSKNAILGICHEVRNDAMPVLAKHTTLEIRNSFLREDPLRIVPTAFLGKISIINVDLDAFVHLKRELLPSLEHVGLIVRVEGITSIHQAIHFLHCPSCGGPDMVLAEGVGDMLDWPWMRNQIIQLSKAEGWTVDLKVLWECYSPNDSYLEVLYDIETSRVLHKKGFVQGNVFDASDWGHASQQVGDLAKELGNPIKEEPEWSV